MSPFKLSIAGLALAAGFGLSGCATDGYGGGYGGVSVGYGGGYGYYDGGWDPYYGGYSADPYWGWYGDYYYPGTGYYVFDRQNRRHRWNDGQRNYWQGRSRRTGIVTGATCGRMLARFRRQPWRRAQWRRVPRRWRRYPRSGWKPWRRRDLRQWWRQPRRLREPRWWRKSRGGGGRGGGDRR